MSSNFDPLDIRGQEREREDKLRLATIEIENEESDLKWLMSGRRGRRFGWTPPTRSCRSRQLPWLMIHK